MVPVLGVGKNRVGDIREISKQSWLRDGGLLLVVCRMLNFHRFADFADA